MLFFTVTCNIGVKNGISLWVSFSLLSKLKMNRRARLRMNIIFAAFVLAIANFNDPFRN